MKQAKSKQAKRAKKALKPKVAPTLTGLAIIFKQIQIVEEKTLENCMTTSEYELAPMLAKPSKYQQADIFRKCFLVYGLNKEFIVNKETHRYIMGKFGRSRGKILIEYKTPAYLIRPDDKDKLSYPWDRCRYFTFEELFGSVN